MAYKISREEMLEASKDFNPDEGGQVRMNHYGCPGGEDTRRRLYVRRTDDNRLLLFHCFNCGGSGVLGLGINVSKGKVTDTATVVDRDRLNEYLETCTRYGRASYPSGGHLNGSFPFNKFLDCLPELEAVSCFGMRIDADYAYIPRGDIGNGIDLRTRPWSEAQILHGAPKWKRILNPELENSSQLLIYNKNNSKLAVIVEDPVSAMKVSLCGYAGVALCGSNLSQDDAFKISMLFEEAIIWLDNDKPEITLASIAANKRLGLYMSRVGRETVFNDPKNYTRDDISRTVAAIHRGL